MYWTMEKLKPSHCNVANMCTIICYIFHALYATIFPIQNNIQAPGSPSIHTDYKQNDQIYHCHLESSCLKAPAQALEYIHVGDFLVLQSTGF